MHSACTATTLSVLASLLAHPVNLLLWSVRTAHRYVPEWVDLENTIVERYDEAVRLITIRWNTSREALDRYNLHHPSAPIPPDTHPVYLGYFDHFKPTNPAYPSHIYGERWASFVADFNAEIKSINGTITRFNFICPVSNKQRVLYLPQNVIAHVQLYRPTMEGVVEGMDGSGFTYGRVKGGSVSRVVVAALTVPILGVLSWMGWMVRRHRVRSQRALVHER